jgi:hypothetical protein
MNDRVTERSGKIIALLQEKVRLEPLPRRLFYLGFATVWGSGSLWLLAEWFKDPELGPGRSLLQTATMKVHGAAMLVYLIMLGTLFTHVRRGTALKANRLSGFSTIGLNGTLVLTGWMLYYLTDEALRAWSSTVHWTIGLSTLLILVAHVQLGGRWARKLAAKDHNTRAQPSAGHDENRQHEAV